MKRAWSLFLTAATFLTGCAAVPPATSSVENTSSTHTASVEETSSVVTPSEAASSEEVSVSSEAAEPSFPVQTEATFEHDGVTYFNVTAASKGKPPVGNDDEFFPADAEGYYIEKGVYQISDEVFYRIIDKPFLGDGSIKFKDWKRVNYTPTDTHLFDGVIPISRMNDPLWVVMNSPYEAENYRTVVAHEHNGDTNVNARPEDHSSTVLCAVYLDANCTLPDDTKLTLCIGKARMAYRFAGEDWKLVYDDLFYRPESLYPLPWQLHPNTVKENKIENVTQVDDHWEVELTVGDFRVKEGEPERMVGRVLHTWNQSWFRYPQGKTGADVLGIAVNYKIWVKEPEYAGVLNADTGVDQYAKDIPVGQAFSTKSFIVTDKPRDVYGHTVCPQCYDTVMDDPAKVVEMLGIED